MHVGEFFLNQLIRGERTAELLAIEHVLPRGVPAELRGAERTPCDAVTRRIETPEGSLETLNVRQHLVRRNEHIVHDDFAGDRCSQAELAFNLRGREALHSLFDNESANGLAVILCPDHEYVGDRRIRDPRFRAHQPETAIDGARTRRHRAWIGAVVGLSQAKASDRLACGKPRQVFAPLFLAAVHVDREHHERALHAHHRAITQLRSCTGSRSPGAAQPARGTLPHEANQGVAALASRRVAPALPLAAASASGGLLVLVAALVPAEPAESIAFPVTTEQRDRLVLLQEHLATQDPAMQ